jgi:dihydroxy-acid dehydratase
MFRNHTAVWNVPQGYLADAIITLSGCDKTVPASLMPIPRHNSFGLSLYGGTALPGQVGS